MSRKRGKFKVFHLKSHEKVGIQKFTKILIITETIFLNFFKNFYAKIDWSFLHDFWKMKNFQKKQLIRNN